MTPYTLNPNKWFRRLDFSLRFHRDRVPHPFTVRL